jgi:hydroxyacylglutathione hydrolase
LSELEIIPFILGPVQTNSFLAADPASREAVVIDPSWDGQKIVRAANDRGWRITSVLITHAHFDHLGGVAGVVDHANPVPTLALHPADLFLWRMQGGAPLFGMKIDPAPEPTVELSHGMTIHLGEHVFEVRHAPGHTPGHVIFVCQAQKTAFVGDVIFQGSVGRADLPGGDFDTLIESIHRQVMSLSDDIILYPGHGPVTTVGEERANNPFLTSGDSHF